ncbi:hypothetical protein Tco_0846530, partial [Tanacetum coccineum]
MFEKIRLIRNEKERLEVRRNVRSRKTIKKERNRLEVKRPFEVRKEVYEKCGPIDEYDD